MNHHPITWLRRRRWTIALLAATIAFTSISVWIWIMSVRWAAR